MNMIANGRTNMTKANTNVKIKSQIAMVVSGLYFSVVDAPVTLSAYSAFIDSRSRA